MMVKLIHINIDEIFTGWRISPAWDDEEDAPCKFSVGRITQWGGHYIAVIHDDVPEDERAEVAEFIAEAPEKIRQLESEVARLKNEIVSFTLNKK